MRISFFVEFIFVLHATVSKFFFDETKRRICGKCFISRFSLKKVSFIQDYSDDIITNVL